MSWDDYTRVVLRIELPEGTLRIKPAALGKPHHIDFPDTHGGTIHVITAYNPAGEVVPDEVNTLAHERLAGRLKELGSTYLAATGGDVEWTHVEPGFAVVGMTAEDARALGREFGQEAIFGWSPTALVVLSCDTSRIHMTGWSVVPDPGTSDAADLEEESLTGGDECQTEDDASPDTDNAPASEVAAAKTPKRVNAPEERLVDVPPPIGDEEYFRALAIRSGLLFAVYDENEDELAVIRQTGAAIEVSHNAGVERINLDQVAQLPDLLERLNPEGRWISFVSAGWGSGDIAYLFGASDDLVIDDVEWSCATWSPSPEAHRPICVPPLGDAPTSCRVASLDWEIPGGSGSMVSGDDGTDYLLKIGPRFVVQGDEWANVLRAGSRQGAIQEFTAEIESMDHLRTSLFVEPDPDE
jgi:hypothetical protein